MWKFYKKFSVFTFAHGPLFNVVVTCQPFHLAYRRLCEIETIPSLSSNQKGHKIEMSCQDFDKFCFKISWSWKIHSHFGRFAMISYHFVCLYLVHMPQFHQIDSLQSNRPLVQLRFGKRLWEAEWDSFLAPQEAWPPLSEAVSGHLGSIGTLHAAEKSTKGKPETESD